MMTKPCISQYKVLTFDCYGTLVDWESGIISTLKPWLIKNGIKTTDREIISLFAKFESDALELNPQANYRDILKQVHLSIALHYKINSDSILSSDDFSCSVKHWLPYEDTISSLQYLQNHYKLAILSNIDNTSISSTCSSLKSDFIGIYTAENIGSYKPNIRNFETLLKELGKLGYTNQDILHVSVSLFHDHVPAQKLGLATCLIKRPSFFTSWDQTKQITMTCKANFEFNKLCDLVNRHKNELKIKPNS